MTNNMMAASSGLPQVLVSQYLAAAETQQYLVLPLTSVKIANAGLTNTSGSAVSVSVSLVKTGGTAGTSNRVLHAFSLQAGDSTRLPELSDHVMGPGDFISTLAGTASAVAFVVSGVVFS